MAENNNTSEDVIRDDAGPVVNHNKVILQWKAPEYIIHQKGKTWFLIAGIITLLLVIYAIYTDSATMAIVFIVLAGVYYLTHNQIPKIIDISIAEMGVFIDKKFYPYNMINSFWIVYHPPFVHSLYLRLSGKTFTKLVIQLDAQDPVEVRRALAKEIPEVEGGSESISEMLIRMLRL